MKRKKKKKKLIAYTIIANKKYIIRNIYVGYVLILNTGKDYILYNIFF